jgi:hypothetical protein
MKNNRLASLLALAMVAAMIAYFPPGPFSWRTFINDQSSVWMKLVFLGKVYLMPAALSFAAVVGFRLQMGISMTGASSGAVFPVALLASVAMMSALRSMSGGVGGVPGYAVGMAVGYTLMSKIYGLRKTDQTVFGRPVLKIVWRKDLEAAPQPSSAAA